MNTLTVVADWGRAVWARVGGDKPKACTILGHEGFVMADFRYVEADGPWKIDGAWSSYGIGHYYACVRCGERFFFTSYGHHVHEVLDGHDCAQQQALFADAADGLAT